MAEKKEKKYVSDNPQLMAEWNWEKNVDADPTKITIGSHKKVWWKCSEGHEWEASLNHRTSKGRGCPYCCHNPCVLSGVNDLQTIYPDLAKEWHPTKNGTLQPHQVTAKSSKKIWWKCSKGHEWKTAVNHRANGSGCPYCRNALQTSFPEQAIYYYVKIAYADAINGYTDIFKNHGMELDIYIPSLNIGIEYDGSAFHKTKVQQQREMKKYRICQDNGILLIRIRENTVDNVDNICDKAILLIGNLTESIERLKLFLPNINDVDVARDEMHIRSNYHSKLKEKSLLHLYPKLCEEWNYDNNKELMPDMFAARSNAKVWWKCSKGHEWSASIDDRVSGNGCPYCGNRKILLGYNDFASKRPDLIKEWDYSKNSFSPDSVLPGSGKKAWWVCSVCGNNWLAEISSRNKGAGCPQCAKEKRKANKNNTD